MMARKKRIWLKDKFYHIVCRGNRRDPLFRERHDFIEILAMLEKIYEKIPYQLVDSVVPVTPRIILFHRDVSHMGNTFKNRGKPVGCTDIIML